MAKKQSELKQKLAIRIGKGASKSVDPTNGTARKVSVSLYPADEERIREVQRGLLNEHGVQVSDSEALRLVLRSATIDPAELMTTRERIANEDQRRRPR